MSHISACATPAFLYCYPIMFTGRLYKDIAFIKKMLTFHIIFQLCSLITRTHTCKLLIYQRLLSTVINAFLNSLHTCLTNPFPFPTLISHFNGFNAKLILHKFQSLQSDQPSREAEIVKWPFTSQTFLRSAVLSSQLVTCYQSVFIKYWQISPIRRKRRIKQL